MITIRSRSHTFALGPNSRLNTPIGPGPQTSCVIKTSAFTQMLSPASTLALCAARARIFSVNVKNSGPSLTGVQVDCNRGNRAQPDTTTNLRGPAKRNAAFTLQQG